MDIQTVQEKIKNIKRAIKVKQSEARKILDEIAVEKVSIRSDDRKLRSLEKQLTQLKLEISKNLPEALESAEEELRAAEKEAEEVKKLIPKMEALVPAWKKKSKELLAALKKEIKPVNDELRQMSSGYNMMQTKTGKGMDLTGISSGFHSLDAIIGVLEKEIAGTPRTKTMITYPPNFPL